MFRFKKKYFFKKNKQQKTKRNEKNGSPDVGLRPSWHAWRAGCAVTGSASTSSVDSTSRTNFLYQTRGHSYAPIGAAAACAHPGVHRGSLLDRGPTRQVVIFYFPFFFPFSFLFSFFKV
jgi:hypothetical protein